MQKNKRHASAKTAKSAESPDAQEDVLVQALHDLAIDLAAHDDGSPMKEPLKEKKNDFHRIIRKCLFQKKDDALYEALEHARDDDSEAYEYLKEHIEEASGIVVFRRGEGQSLEVNAFVIPVFARTHGGLHKEQCFQDEEAFELLTKSLQKARLESADATVVLISHAYHLDEIDRIRYSQLNDMVREAFDSMTSRKPSPTSAIDRSMSGWPENHFAPEDLAVELRFLLGFALKTTDDPFYQVPDDDAAADRYFDARAKRFQQWTQQVAPLVKRCLVTDGREVDLDFLYQDLFHGGKERGMTEYDMLQMMSDLHHGLQLHDVSPEQTHAIIGPADTDGETVIRVNLYAEADGALVASSEKSLDIARDVQTEADDAYDAVMTIGVKSVALAAKFDSDGKAVNARPYKA